MKANKFTSLFLALLLLILLLAVAFYLSPQEFASQFMLSNLPSAIHQDKLVANSSPVILTEPWLYTFDTPGTLQEAGSEEESTSEFWWLSSGGVLNIVDGVGQTLKKTETPPKRWSLAYFINNSLDTDKGRYPQNIFRLVSKPTVGDADVSLSFKITGLNLTDTPNRDGWSGVLLFTRYQDSDNLYYAGVRQDGHVVIKKKIKGTYYTLAEETYFTGKNSYNKNTYPNLIPGEKWIDMRLSTKTFSDSIELTLYLKEDGDEDWKAVASATDKNVGGPAFLDNGRFGIRTDYMDVEFDNFNVVPTD